MTIASIVTFNHSITEITELLEGLIKSPVDRIYVIDNTDQDYLRDVERIAPNIRYIHNENIGYGRSHNIAIRAALEKDAKYHIVLNPDVHFEEGVIEELTKYMEENPDVGNVMPKVLYPDGTLQYLCKLLPTPMDLVVRRFIPFRKIKQLSDSRYELHKSGYDKIAEIPSLSGCFMFLRCSTLLQSGIFDDRFFLYAEDLDLCRRIGEFAKTMYYPHVSITHDYEKGSYKNRKLLKYHLVSVLKYFNKWGWFFDSKRGEINRATLNRLNIKD